MTGRTAQNAVATAQIIGDRDNQEDTLATHELDANTGKHAGELLLLPADGMGGRAGGEVASRLVVEHFSEAYMKSHANISESLRNSLNSANEQLANAVVDTGPQK
jgi:serine/threonine protein phosphatase PrpC